jgi:hypothetical protein
LANTIELIIKAALEGGESFAKLQDTLRQVQTATGAVGKASDEASKSIEGFRGILEGFGEGFQKAVDAALENIAGLREELERTGQSATHLEGIEGFLQGLGQSAAKEIGAASTALDELGKAAQETEEDEAKLSGTTKDTSAALEQLNTVATVLGVTFQPLTQSLLLAQKAMVLFKANLPIAGATAAIGIFAFLGKQAADLGAQFDKLSKNTGLTTETLSALRIAADDNNSSIEQLSTGLRFFNRNLSLAARGIGSARNLFLDLGFTVNELQEALENPDAALERFARRFVQIRSAAQRTEVAMRFFGRGGQEVVQVLQDIGTKGLDPFREKAQALGLLVDSELARAGRDFNNQMTDLKNSLSGLAVTIGREVLPALNGLLSIINQLLRIDTRNVSQKLADTTNKVIDIESRVIRLLGISSKDAGVTLRDLQKMKPDEILRLLDYTRYLPSPDARKRLRESLNDLAKAREEMAKLNDQLTAEREREKGDGTPPPDIGGTDAAKVIKNFREQLEQQIALNAKGTAILPTQAGVNLAKLILGDEAGMRKQLEAQFEQFKKAFEEAFPGRTPPSLERFRKEIEAIIKDFKLAQEIAERIQEAERADAERQREDQQQTPEQARAQRERFLNEQLAREINQKRILEFSEQGRLALLNDQLQVLKDQDASYGAILSVAKEIDEVERSLVALEIEKKKAALATAEAKGDVAKQERELLEAEIKLLETRLQITGTKARDAARELKEAIEEQASEAAKSFVDRLLDGLENKENNFRDFFRSMGRALAADLLQEALKQQLIEQGKQQAAVLGEAPKDTVGGQFLQQIRYLGHLLGIEFAQTLGKKADPLLTAGNTMQTAADKHIQAATAWSNALHGAGPTGVRLAGAGPAAPIRGITENETISLDEALNDFYEQHERETAEQSGGFGLANTQQFLPAGMDLFTGIGALTAGKQPGALGILNQLGGGFTALKGGLEAIQALSKFDFAKNLGGAGDFFGKIFGGAGDFFKLIGGFLGFGGAAHGGMFVPSQLSNAVSSGAIKKFRSGGMTRGPVLGVLGEEGPEIVARMKPAGAHDRVAGGGDGGGEGLQQNIFLVDQRRPNLGPNDVEIIIEDSINRGRGVAKSVTNVVRRSRGRRG